MIPDDMILKMNNPSLFFSRDLQKYVKEEFRMMKRPLKK
jgi:hypothetical protein